MGRSGLFILAAAIAFIVAAVLVVTGGNPKAVEVLLLAGLASFALARYPCEPA